MSFENIEKQITKYIRSKIPVGLNMRLNGERHFAIIVGCRVNRKTGKLLGVKIQNSWGEGWGAGGYLDLTAEELKASFDSLLVFENTM